MSQIRGSQVRAGTLELSHLATAAAAALLTKNAGAVDLDGAILSGAGDAVENTDLATFGQAKQIGVDAQNAAMTSAFNGAVVRYPVRAVATTNQSLVQGTAYTIDTILLAENDTVLLTGQTNATQNGIYIVSATNNLVRFGQWGAGVTYNQGLIVPVLTGTANAGSFWTLNAAVTVDGAGANGEAHFTKLPQAAGGGTSYTFQNGVVDTAGVVSVVVDATGIANGLTVSGTGLSLAAIPKSALAFGDDILVKDEGTGNVAIAGKLTGVTAGTADTDGINKLQLDTAIAGVSGAAGIVGEVPAGTVDAVNKTFTLANAAVLTSIAFYRNGLRSAITGAATAAGVTTFDSVDALEAGDVVLVDYIKA